MPARSTAVMCTRSEEHTSELQSLAYLVCRLLLEKKKKWDLWALSRSSKASIPASFCCAGHDKAGVAWLKLQKQFGISAFIAHIFFFNDTATTEIYTLSLHDALPIWDAPRRRLVLARDRLGIKPLYYSAEGGRIRFASEIKALLADPQQPRTVN